MTIAAFHCQMPASTGPRSAVDGPLLLSLPIVRDSLGRSTGRRNEEWWSCPKGCNWDLVDRFREWRAAEADREMEEHAARVRAQQEEVAQQIDAILDSDPDADDEEEEPLCWIWPANVVSGSNLGMVSSSASSVAQAAVNNMASAQHTIRVSCACATDYR